MTLPAASNFGDELTAFLSAWPGQSVRAQGCDDSLERFLRSWVELPAQPELAVFDPSGAAQDLAVGDSVAPSFDSADLQNFLSAWADVPQAGEQTAVRLSDFVQKWNTLSEEPNVAPEVQERPFDFARLRDFIGAFPNAYASYQRSGAGINVWELAGLESSEVRIARVLAWLLNPRQPHGLGKSLLVRLLESLAKRGPSSHVPPAGFPTALAVEQSERLSVHLESCPLGDSGNRVDIEIESDELVLFVEVKVYAGEGFEQLKRYHEVAAIKAENVREWGVLYLTPTGRLTSEQAGLGRVVGVSWREVSRGLAAVLTSKSGDTSYAVNVLVQHYIRFVNRL